MVAADAAQAAEVGIASPMIRDRGLRIVAASIALLVLQACGPDVKVEADKAEAALGELQRLAGKYGGDSAGKVINPHDGAGMLAGTAVKCGVAVTSPGRYAGANPRIMRVGQVNAIEGALGQDPAVFDELWRRAGC